MRTSHLQYPETMPKIQLLRQPYARACLKNHFRNLQAPLCGIFYPHSVAVARYAALIRIKSPTNWDSQFTKSLFQTRSSALSKDEIQSLEELDSERLSANWHIVLLRT